METKKELNIKLDITIWYYIDILYKELNILNIKTWYCISILTYIYVALLTVKECQYGAKYKSIKVYKYRAKYRLIKVCKYTHLYYFKYKYKFY